MRRTPCLLALALALGALAAPAAALDGPAPLPAETLVGTVREVVVEAPGRGSAQAPEVRRLLLVDGRAVALPEGALAGSRQGDTVEVVLRTGPSGTAAVARSRTVRRAPAAARAPGTSASDTDPALHEVYLAVVGPRGSSAVPDAGLPGRAAALVEAASDYWSSQTGGRVRFEVAGTLPTYTSRYACGTDLDPETGLRTPSTVLMWNEALDRFEAASGPGTAYGVDKHLLVVLPDGAARTSPRCDYGLGTVGGLHADGNAALVSDSNRSLYAHELGHNLGLHHSGALHCDTADAVPASTSGGATAWPAARCDGEDYGDLLDVMGYSGSGYGEGSLNGVHLDRMGLSAPAVRSITTDGTTSVDLVPLSSTGPGTRTVVVTDVLGGRYYAEYRTASGRDLAAGRLAEAPSLGVRVLREDPARRNGSFVLDATPTGPVGDYDTSVGVGRSFTSVSGTVSFRVTRAGSTGATLTVTRTPPPAAATVAVPGRAAAGSAATASTRVTADGAAVPSWPVALQVRPVGQSTWTTAAKATTGSTGTATFRYTSGLTAAYRVVTADRPGAPARTSPAGTTTAYAAPTLAAPRSSVSLGTRLALTGTLRDLPSRVVHLQARRGSGSWRTVVQAARDGSTFRAAYRPTSRGTWQLRYAARADAAGRYEAGRSPARTVVVR